MAPAVLVPLKAALASGILTAIPELRDPVLFQVVTDSAMFGLLIATGLLLAAWAAGLSSPGASRGAPRRWLSPITELPPLILGTGVLALPWLIGLVTRFLLDHGQDRAAAVVGKIAAAAEPHKHPWILMGIAVGLVLLPWLFRNQSRHVAVAPSPGGLDPGFEAGVHAGLSRWRARALARPGRLVAAAGRFAVVWVIAATNLSPALILSTGSARKTLGPAVLDLCSGDAVARSQAAALAVFAVFANLAAVAVARPVCASAGGPEL